MQSSATVLSLTEKKELPPRHWGFPGGLVVKESACQCRKLGFDFLVRKAPGEGNGNPLQDSCLGNPMGTELGRLQSIGSQSVRYNLVLIEHARTWTLLDHFLERVDIIESNKGPEHAPSVSHVGEIAACPPSPTDDDPSTLQSPTSSPSFSQYLFLLVHMMPAPVYQLLYCAIVLFKILYCNIKNISFIFLCMFFMDYLCEKFINLL